MHNRYLEKIADIIQENQASADVTPTQPGFNSFGEKGQSSEDEEHNKALQQAEDRANPQSDISDPIKLSDKILRHIAKTYGPEKDPEHEERLDPLQLIQNIRAQRAVTDVERVNNLDPDRASEGPNGTSSEEGIGQNSLKY